MRIFVTGATGFVGTAVVAELLSAGHEVIGLARSEEGAQKLAARGVTVHLGDLQTPDTLRSGSEAADTTIHTGFIHDFSRFAEVCAVDRAAIEALGEVAGRAGKRLIVTSGLAGIDAPRDRFAVEEDRAFPPSDRYRRASEAAMRDLNARGIATTLMRLPFSTHGEGDHGFVPMLIDIARRKGRAAYVGDGANRWTAVHVRDAARAYRLAVERPAGPETWHAVAEEAIPFRRIAEAIAEGLGVPCVSLTPEEAPAYFEWFLGFASMDQGASSERTREGLGWMPVERELMPDIRQAGYFG